MHLIHFKYIKNNVSRQIRIYFDAPKFGKINTIIIYHEYNVTIGV